MTPNVAKETGGTEARAKMDAASFRSIPITSATPWHYAPGVVSVREGREPPFP